jgi:hypothetical protein
MHNLYASQIKEDVMGGACSTYRRDETCTQYSGWKMGREEVLGRPRRRWEDNITNDLTKIGW